MCSPVAEILPPGSGSFQADLDRGPYHPRQGIQAWQSLPASSVRAGGVGRADQTEDRGASRAQALARGGQERLHHNVLAIALANKLARIAWSVLARGRGFEASKLPVAGFSNRRSKGRGPTEVCERTRRDGGSVFPAPAKTGGTFGPTRPFR